MDRRRCATLIWRANCCMEKNHRAGMTAGDDTIFLRRASIVRGGPAKHVEFSNAEGAAFRTPNDAIVGEGEQRNLGPTSSSASANASTKRSPSIFCSACACTPMPSCCSGRPCRTVSQAPCHLLSCCPHRSDSSCFCLSAAGIFVLQGGEDVNLQRTGTKGRLDCPRLRRGCVRHFWRHTGLCPRVAASRRIR